MTKKPKNNTNKISEMQNTNGATEICKVGELYLASESLRADELLKLLVKTLENKNIKSYLNIINTKKSSGSYLG